MTPLFVLAFIRVTIVTQGFAFLGNFATKETCEAALTAQKAAYYRNAGLVCLPVEDAKLNGWKP